MTKQDLSITVAPPSNPTTMEEWQNAVDAAKALLTIESARMYGLIKGGPAVNVERCQELLSCGKSLGVVPSADAVQRYVAGFNSRE